MESVPAPHLHPWWGLAPSAGSLTQHPAWLEAAAEAFGGPRTLCIQVGPDEDPRAVALLANPRWGRALRLLGEAELSEPGDVLVRDPDARRELAARLAALGRVVEFARLDPRTGTVEAMQAAWARKGTLIVRPRPGTPRVDLDPSWSDPAAHLTARRRSDLRRAQRRAADLGAVHVAIVAPDLATYEAPWEEALSVELTSWKGSVGAGIAQDVVRGGFYRAFAREAARAGLLRIALLRIDGQPAAMQIAAAHAGAWWLLKVAYDPAFARCSPGQLLACETLAHAATTGLTRYEFLGRPEPWTRLWAEQETPCVDLVAYPWRPRGLLRLAGRLAGAGLARSGRALRRSSPQVAP